MKYHSLNCLSICDYPIKQSGYEKKLRELGCDSVHQLSKMFELHQLPKAHFELILIDRNIQTEMEPGFLLTISELFPHSNVIMMEEDHEKLWLDRNASRVVAHLGKRSPMEEFDELVKMVLRNAKGGLSKTSLSKTQSVQRLKKIEKEKAYE